MTLKKKNNNFTPIAMFAIKLILGITFVFASYHKIEDPGEFAKIIYGYSIFPDFSINILAIIIPFIELIAGFSLIFNFFPRAALLLINTLLSGFILVIGFNLLKGHEFDCGCFSLSGQASPFSNHFLLVRDVFLLGSGIYLWQKLRPTAS